MKAWELADEFRRIFAADLAFADLNPRTAQDDAARVFPALIFNVQTRALDAHGRALAFRLHATVESHAFDLDGAAPADEAHAARVSAVQRKFFGAAAADLASSKAAITAAIAAGGKFTLRGYDAPPEDNDSDIERHRYRTPILIAGIAVVTGNV